MRLTCKLISGLCLSGLLLLLPGCFPEGVEGCPEDMHLSFFLEDEFDRNGTYDSRVGNEVYVYVFQDQNLLTTIQVPYDEISAGKEYVYRKYDGFEGNLALVGWAVSKDATGDVPDLSNGFGGSTVELTPSTNGKYNPAAIDLFTGNIDVVEIVDESSRHKIGMGVSACRVEVNILDYSGSLKSAAATYAEVTGTMNQMTMRKTGAGMPAEVITELNDINGDGTEWQTGTFGVLPSSEGQTVSVGIYADAALLHTLEVPRENLPTGAVSGGYLIFEYTLGEAHFNITIDGFTQVIRIVDEM